MQELIGMLNKGNLGIEIVDCFLIQGGVEIHARAWKNNKQLGFGKDGSVDIERFRIFNPPTKVPSGEVEQILFNGEMVTRDKFKLSPLEALQEVLLQTVVVVGKENTKVEAGKIGKTTSVFYPSLDGVVYYDDLSSSWATTHDAATGSGNNTTDTAFGIMAGKGGTGNYRLLRGVFYFDTSSIPDADTISSATLEIYVSAKSDDFNTANSFFATVDMTPASDSALADADYDQFGTTLYSDSIDATGVTTSAYNTFTINATGIANISKTGITTWGVRTGEDINNADPGGSNNQFTRIVAVMSETGGTTQDPKLTVVHTGVVANQAPPTLLTMGVG